jgi:hypothetical protein
MLMTFRRLAGLLLIGAGLFVLALRVRGATNQLPFTSRTGLRTNSLPSLGARTNAIKALGHTGTNTNLLRGTNAVVAGQKAGEKAESGFSARLKRIEASRAFYPAVVGIAFCLGALFLARAFKVKKPETPVPSSLTALKPGLRPAAKPSGAKVHSCNVLEVGAQARQVWQFESRASTYVLNREHTSLDGERLPSRIVNKDWRTLFQRKLNVAWLPPENVFLRVAQLPRSDFDETRSMVELQLEKLSPMPVAQVCWSFHCLSHAEGNQQSVIVMIVARNVVEEFLGKLEGQNYLADRLELPLLDQLQTTAITEDGAWIYPDAAGGKNSALVAWWYGGVLRNLDLLTLPAVNPTEGLKEQLLQMSWAGELEGWMTSPPEWHLVADVAVPRWEPHLRAGLERPIEVITPRPASELAALTARRSALAESGSNLLPLEYATKYQQQFHDRLWMRGLLALGGVYLLGVAIYLIALGYATFLTTRVENEVALLGPTYTNSIQLRDRFKVLKERSDLKFAALDCWNTTARLLPENSTLDSLNFTDGKRLALNGLAPTGEMQQLLQFERAMRNAGTGDGQQLFDPNAGDSLQYSTRDTSATWSLNLGLKRSEVQ